MTGNAGERLFEAIGQIPDEMVMEAAQGQTDEMIGNEQPVQDHVVKKETDADKQQPRKKILTIKLGGYLKYLPVVACLCIALGGAGYMLNNFIHMDHAESLDTSGNFDGGTKQTSQDSLDMAMDDAVASNGMEEGNESTIENSMDDANSDSESVQKGLLPIRYDAYEGPVFPLTATGDTQKLKVSRSVKAVIITEDCTQDAQPLLHVTDDYRMKNSSNEDKTLQLVYPFVSTLNQAYEENGEILQISGAEQTSVTYSIGEGINAYKNADLQEQSSMEDYEHIFNGQTDYQEQALEKEADWNKNVQVYTFSNFRTKEGTDVRNQEGVIGVTVKGAGADALTYNFDHSFVKEDGSTNHCFFIPQEQKKLLLIVTGEQDGEPELGYYANLDCEEKLEGIQCEMSRQEMSYADAMRLCSFDAARKLQQAYEQKMYDAVLPEYMNEDAAFGALTMIDEEDTFYRTLVQRYQSTELTEIFERLFGETRVVYAMTTVTIPAKQSIQVSVKIQKRQNAGNYMLADETASGSDSDYQYDFLTAAQSHLQIKKTAFRLTLEDGWQLEDEDLGLEQKQENVWKTDLKEQSCYFKIVHS